MINITSKDGSKFTLSSTRLTETMAKYNNTTGRLLKTRSNYRFVLLKDVKAAFANFQSGYGSTVPTTYVSSGNVDNYHFNFGTAYNSLPGELSIGCVLFSKRTSSKILRAAGVKVPRKAKTLTATAGV